MGTMFASFSKTFMASTDPCEDLKGCPSRGKVYSQGRVHSGSIGRWPELDPEVLRAFAVFAFQRELSRLYSSELIASVSQGGYAAIT